MCLQLQKLAQGHSLDGRVAVWRFRDVEQATAAYTSHAVFLSQEPAYNGIGEQSAHFNNLEGSILHPDYISRGNAILFTRCTVLAQVNLRMAVQKMSADTASLTSALAAYARQLDQRLAKQVG